MQKESKSKVGEVLKLPQTLHETLLELAYQKAQIDKQMGTIVQTFFITKGLDPKQYEINLEQNIIQTKNQILPKTVIEKESGIDVEKEN